MPLESATTIADLDSSYPLPGDTTNEGDDHIRLTKNVLQLQFPGEAGNGFATPILATEADLNATQGASSNFQTQIDDLQSQVSALPLQILQSTYPVGSIFTSIVATNPSTVFGFGTWAQYAEGKVLIGVDSTDPDFDAPEKTGGSKDAIVPTHDHSASSVAAGGHSHTLPNGNFVATEGSNFERFDAGDPSDPWKLQQSTTSAIGDHTHNVTVNNAGEDPTGKNLPPYITVYFWIRTA